MTKVNPIQIQKYLKGIDYPAGKGDIVQRAEENGADDTILSTLQELPDTSFDSPADVSEAAGTIQ